MAIEVNPRVPTRFYEETTALAEKIGVDVAPALAPLSDAIRRRDIIRGLRKSTADPGVARDEILAASPDDLPALVARLAEERARAVAIQDIVAGPGNLGQALEHQIATASMAVHEATLTAFVPAFDKAARAATKAIEASPAGVDLFDPAAVLAAGVEKSHRDLVASLSVLKSISDLARHGARRYPGFIAAVEVPAGTQVERLTNSGRTPAGETPLPDETKALNAQVMSVARAGSFGHQVVAAVRAGFGLVLATTEAELQDRLEAAERAETVQYVDRLGPASRTLR